jgi:hypothetical protein
VTPDLGVKDMIRSWLIFLIRPPCDTS